MIKSLRRLAEELTQSSVSLSSDAQGIIRGTRLRRMSASPPTPILIIILIIVVVIIIILNIKAPILHPS